MTNHDKIEMYKKILEKVYAYFEKNSYDSCWVFLCLEIKKIQYPHLSSSEINYEKEFPEFYKYLNIKNGISEPFDSDSERAFILENIIEELQINS